MVEDEAIWYVACGCGRMEQTRDKMALFGALDHETVQEGSVEGHRLPMQLHAHRCWLGESPWMTSMRTLTLS